MVLALGFHIMRGELSHTPETTPPAGSDDPAVSNPAAMVPVLVPGNMHASGA